MKDEQFFEEKAYRPETNQRPGVGSAGSGVISGDPNNVVSIYVNSNQASNGSSNYNYYHPSNYIPSNSSARYNQNIYAHPPVVRQGSHHLHESNHSPYRQTHPQDSNGEVRHNQVYDTRSGRYVRPAGSNSYGNSKLAQSEPIYNNSYESVFLPISENSAKTVRTMSSSNSSPQTVKQHLDGENARLHQQQLLSHLPRPTPYKSAAVWSHLTPSQQQQQQQSSSNQNYSQVRVYGTKVHQPQSYYPFNQGGSSGPHSLTSTNSSGGVYSSSGGYGGVLRGIREEASGAKSHESVLAVSAGEGNPGGGNRYGSMECLPTGAGGTGGGYQGHGRSNPWAVTPGYRYSISTGPAELDSRRDSTISLPPSSNVGTFSYGAQRPEDLTEGYISKDGHSMKSPNKVTLKEMSLYHSLDTGSLDSPLVDRIRKSCEQKEEFLKRPNQPFVWAPTTSSSGTAGFPKELYAKPQKFQSVPWPPASVAMSNMTGGGLQQSMSTPTANILVNSSSSQQNAHSVSRTSSANSFSNRNNENGEKGGHYAGSLTDYGSAKNRLTVVGSGKLHCDPPPEWVTSSSGTVHSSGNLESLSTGSPSASTSIRNTSSSPKPSNTTNSNDETDFIVQNRNGSIAQNNAKLSEVLPVIKASRKVKYRNPQTPSIRAPRPEQLLLPKKYTRVNHNHHHHQSKSSSRFDNDVILRKRENETEYDNDRIVRRVSYLRATSSPIDMERKSTSPTSPAKSFDYDETLLLLPPLQKSTTDPGSSPGRRRSMANKLSADFLHKGRIIRLKQFFEDHTQPSSIFKFYTDSPSTEFRHFGSPRSEKSPDDLQILKEGPVHFKVRAGENKKQGYYRPWKQGWALLNRSGNLYLSKDHITKESISCSDENCAILCVGLKNGVVVEHADDYSKRKNVIRIKTCPSAMSSVSSSSGNGATAGANVSLLTSPASEGPAMLHSAEILMQVDDNSEWLKLLQQQQDNNNYCGPRRGIASSSASSNSGVLTNGTQSSDSSTKTNIFKNLLTSPSNSNSGNASGHGGVNSPNLLAVGATTNMLTNPTSPKANTWKDKFAKQWKMMISPGTSPHGSSNAAGPVADSGATFGVLLEDCPTSETNPYVPRVLEICVNTMEARGLGIQGIYRIPGNNAAVSALIDSLNKGNDPSPEQDGRWNDVHVISSMLKSFLRHLPDPLLTSERYDDFIKGVSEVTDEAQFDRIKALIDDLPRQNHETLRYLILHLKKVSEHWERNRMDPRNLAIVFGPTLVRTAGGSVTSMVNDMKQQCKLVELLINQAYKFFPPHETTPKETSVTLVKTPNNSPVPGTQQSIESAKREDNIQVSLKESLKGSLKEAVQRKVSRQPLPPPHNTYGLPSTPSPPANKAIDESGTIRSYTGLGAETEQRVRQFEQETRAYLARDARPGFGSGKISPGVTSSSDSVQNSARISARKQSPITPGEVESLRMDKLRLEAEWRKAKDDMENEDFYDRLADNPSSIVQHREQGLPAFVLSHNVSSSSVSSSNSAGGPASADGSDNLPSLTTGSSGTISTWPMKLGPTPFKPTYASTSMVPTLPPKPPLASPHGVNSPANAPVKVAKFAPTFAHSIAGGFAPVRKVNSVEHLYGESSMRTDSFSSGSEIFDHHKITGKETLQRIRRQEGAVVSGHDAKIFGSLDSLRDIVHGSSKEDLSPRSSDGSDLVASLTKTLDKKLEALRPKKLDSDEAKPEVQENAKAIVLRDAMTPNGLYDSASGACEDSNQTDATRNIQARNSKDGQKDSERNSIQLIEPGNHGRRENGEAHEDQSERDEKQDSLGLSYRDPSLHRSASAKAGSDSAQKRMMELLGQSVASGNSNKDNTRKRGEHKRQSSISLTKDGKGSKNRLKDPRRRHSLNGTADILRLVLEDHRRQGNGLNALGRSNLHHHHHMHHGNAAPTDSLATALAANNILESHV